MSTSRSLNKVLLIGNLTRNPVIRQTTTGSIVCTFGLATNSTWKDGQGNAQERTEFHNIVAWNKLGEICAQLLATGMSVYLEGELRTRTWDDANGIRHFRTEVKLQDMKLLDDKGKKGVGLDGAKQNADEIVKEDPIIEDEVEAQPAESKQADNKEDSKEGEELF